MKNFIKIVDPDLAERLSNLGFIYVKEPDCYAFIYDEKLMNLLNVNFGCTEQVHEIMLRF